MEEIKYRHQIWRGEIKHLMNVSKENVEKLQEELLKLDTTNVVVNGKFIKPSSCYYLGSQPLHVLYNTNCPDTLKEIIDDIITKYSAKDEDGSHK
jgi:hypothetical protein